MGGPTLTDDAKDDIRGLDRSVQARILKDLQKFNTSPADRGQPLGSRTGGNLTGLRKLRVGPKGAYRAVSAVTGNEVAVVMVVAARAESECYELARTRIDLMPDSPGVPEMKRFLRSIIGR